MTSLKNKKTFRSIALYLGTSWVILEASSYFLDRYKFPDYFKEALMILLGFGLLGLLLTRWSVLRKNSGFYFMSHVLNVTAAVMVLYLFMSVERKSEVYQYDMTDKVSIAVLPFEDISPERNYAWIGDGFCREIINQLSIVKSIDIKSPAASFYFKDKDMDLLRTASLLGVKNILEGSVQVIDSIMRISVNLVDPSTGSQMWNESFDRDLRDFMNVQKEIALTIAGKIKVDLSEKEIAEMNNPYTKNEAAYDAYLKGKHHFYLLTPNDNFRANKYFEQAISLDPDFAEAFVYLGLTYNEYGGQWLGITPDSAYYVVDSLARHALQIQPGLPLANFLIANVEFFYKWNFQEAVRIATQAANETTRLDDMLLIYGIMMDFTRQHEKSIAFSSQYIEKNPTAPSGYHAKGAALLTQGNAGQAIPFLQKALDLDPHLAWTRLLLAEAYLYIKNYELAQAHVDTLYQLGPAPSFVEAMHRVHYYAGSKEASEEYFDILISINENFPIPFQMAKAYAVRGNIDKMIEQLEISYSMRDIQMISIWREFPFEPYHEDPRFISLLERMNYPF